MKSAEEILKSKLITETMLINSCDYTYFKVIEAMEEYAAQFKSNNVKLKETGGMPLLQKFLSLLGYKSK